VTAPLNQNHQNLVSSINPRARRLSLRVDNKAGVIKLSIPKWTMQWQIDRFLKKNADWIAEKQSTLLPKVNITDGAVIPFRGGECEVIIEHHTKRTTLINAVDNIITIQTSRPDPTSNLKRWIIDQARVVIEPLANAKALRIHKTIAKIDLRDPTSRWGSCSTDARLMFSWRVIMAPPYVLDYLVAHEVAHLKHMDHSKTFWDLCYDLADSPDEGRAWLKDNGNGLLRYF
jgi:predicted metal-dependent hydrolase